MKRTEVEALQAQTKLALVEQAKAAGHSFDQARASKDALVAMLCGAKVIPARFPSKCRCCGGTIAKGEFIVHDTVEHKAAHPSCWLTVPEEGAAVQQQQQPAAPAADLFNDRQEQTFMQAHQQPPADAAAAIGAAVSGAIAAACANMQPQLDPEQVRAIVREEVGAQRPLQINIANREPVCLPVGMHHPMFEKVLRLAGAGLNVLMVGPAGSGKSHLAAEIAQALGRNYGALHCTAGASESQLMGWLLPTGEAGRFEYAPAPFVMIYEQGGLFLLDEIDAADPNMLMCINGALANGHLHIPQRLGKPSAERHPDAVIIAAANTFGTGADFIYAGRNQLDGATLDRFYVVSIDYNSALEASIMGQQAEQPAPWKAAETDEISVKADLTVLHDYINSVRAKAAAAKLRRVVSTRTFQKAAAARMAGVPLKEVKADIFAGWTRDELAKVA